MTPSNDRHADAEGSPLAYVLAADIGNTRTTLGVVQGETAYAQVTVATADRNAMAELVKQMWEAMTSPRRIVACSVASRSLEIFREVVDETLDEPVAVIGEDIPLPIEVGIPHPERIGTDRLCGAAAAFGKLQQECVVVDLGTAITVDCISNEGVFLGGAILPGMRMQARALHEGTARLPEVEPAEPAGVFGEDTAEAIRSGIVAGVRGAVRGLVEAYATELNQWPIVVTTGGDAALFGNPEGIVQAQAPPLCLLGIARALYQSLAESPQ
ncbi:MAG: type III pantothenate kinase [Planctomycetota bacterium]